MTADEILASKTIEQLQSGLRRGQMQLEGLDATEGVSEDDWDGPFPPSKAFEQWELNTQSNRRRMLNLAMADTRAEINRRMEREKSK